MESIGIPTTQREQILDITRHLEDFLKRNRCQDGLLAVFCPHTTAAISVNENADPDVKRDMLFHLKKMVPQSPEFHHAEGNADSHIKAALTGLSQVFIVENGKIQLGTWQGVYFMEFDGPRHRKVWLKFIPG